jgi:hypothetical protein
MRPGFTIYVDAKGDLYAAEGTVISRDSGEVFIVAAPAETSDGLIGLLADHFRDAAELPSAENAIFLGGSGRNLIITGLADFAGIWTPGRPGFWKLGDFVLEVTGSSAATISDATDVIAILSTGGTAPVGDFDSTSYGEGAYNGSTPFVLVAVGEDGWPGALPDLEVEISAGTALGGTYTAVDAVTYEAASDPDWAFDIASDGTAEMLYDGTAMAARASGLEDDPCGLYVATPDGERLNPEPLDDEEGTAPGTNPFGILTLEFNWAGTPDLDIGVSFLGLIAGFDHSSAGAVGDYMNWSGDNVTDGGPETVTIDLEAAWDAGDIALFADVLAMADWYPPAGGSGPATLTVTYSLDGIPVDYVIHPNSATPASTPALVLRVLADGSVTPTGVEWTATVRAVRRVPVEGVVYLTLTETAGVLTAAEGPAFAAVLPTSGSGVFYYPLASSDGLGGLRQIHTGPLIW